MIQANVTNIVANSYPRLSTQSGCCSGYNCGAVCGVVFITTAQLHSTKPELRFSAGSNPVRGVSEIGICKDFRQFVMIGNKDKCLLSLNHATKTIHYQIKMLF